ncbi:MAG: hypothetical protein H3Z53_08535 [archaeon]|nr:hypothetical protein [archaeon]MCP8314398.1 hypothetical protein [archaeon]MCP8317769.1 hypothetical protein [archaeon]MCP8320453.1 hypothetical protein [archaeon]
MTVKLISLSEKKHPKPLIIGFAIAIVAILIGAVALLYHPYVTENPTQAWLEDSEDDVEFIGEDYPSIIDVTYAELEVNEGVLKFTITVMDSIPEYLNNGEYAQWMAIIILQDGLFRAYEVYMEMNSTLNQGELVGYFREIGEQEAEPCVVERNGNSLIIFAPLDELQSSREILWSILTTFEKWSGYELIANGIDYAPDEGFQRTILKK